MSRDEKELLLCNLHELLRYGIMCSCDGNDCPLSADYLKNVNGQIRVYFKEYSQHSYPIEVVKPYLRSMSSMTDDERKKFGGLSAHAINIICGTPIYYLLERHLDFSNLIEKGLALEAPEGMYES